MSISSSLNAGVQGLAVNATRLAAISDNIANSATDGYKRTETDFTSVVLQESPSRYTAGGVRAVVHKDVQASGQLLGTSSSTDISVVGGGFLPVAMLSDPLAATAGGTDSLLMTTTGSFQPDADGYLRDPSGHYLLGWPYDATGNPALGSRDSASGLVPVNVNDRSFAARATTEIGLAVNLPAEDTATGAAGTPYSLPIGYFDNLGASESLDLTFTPTIPGAGSSNTWTLTIDDSALGAQIADVTLVFDTAAGAGGSLLSVTPAPGSSYDSTTGNLTVTTASGPIDIFIGQPGELSGISQLAGDFTPVSISKNGASFGNLTTVEIDEAGVLQAIFDNGERVPIYQIPVVHVPNPNGLQAVDGQAFRVSEQSGDFYLWDAGTGPTGRVEGFALEQSTTDIAQELTRLIETQRAYSSNAKIIQTVDEMLQETTNIKR